MKLIFALSALLLSGASAYKGRRMRQYIGGQDRHVLFHSRHMVENECTMTCDTAFADGETFPPTKAPTSGPTSGPTTSPTSGPTSGPTKAPTSGPTASPTKGPTTSPHAGPTASPTSGPTASPTSGPTTAPTAGPTASPTAGPTTPIPTSAPTGCPLVDLDFNDLTAGEYIYDQLWDSHGVKITAIKSGNKGFTPINGAHNSAGGGAMVFDTLHPDGDHGQGLCTGDDGDIDLGAPNEFCGGPGSGDGGKPFLEDGVTDNPYKNCEPLGNVLIIQESNKDCPDDSGSGGWIQFEFKGPSYVRLAKLLDVDEGNTPDIEIFTGDNSLADTVHVDPTGDNGVIDEVLNHSDVTKVKIRYHGSGSIARLVYEQCPPAEFTPDVTDVCPVGDEYEDPEMLDKFSSTVVPLPLDPESEQYGPHSFPIKITGCGDGTVKFQVKNFMKDSSISWIAVWRTLNNVPDCDKENEVQANEVVQADVFGTFEADCDERGLAKVVLYSHDGSFKNLWDITQFVPGMCNPSNDLARKIMQVFHIPCTAEAYNIAEIDHGDLPNIDNPCLGEDLPCSVNNEGNDYCCDGFSCNTASGLCE